MILVVVLDLQTQSPKHAQLYEYLKNQGAWAHYLRPIWFLDTSNTPQQVYEGMKSLIEPGDRFFITQLGNYYGWGPGDMWTWLRNHIRS
jgi:hypothetical protein